MTPLEQCDMEIAACENGTYDAPLWHYLLGYADWQMEKRLILAEMNDNRRILTFAVGGPLRGYYADLTVLDEENGSEEFSESSPTGVSRRKGAGEIIRAWAFEHFPKDWADTYFVADGEHQIYEHALKLLCKGRIEYFNGKTFFHE